MGRAVLVLQRENPRPYLEAIVEACLHNQAYDPQVEGNRITYLSDLLRLSGDPSYVRSRVLDALRTTRPDDHWDLAQLFGLALSFALEGDEAARTAMYARFAAKAADLSLDRDAFDSGAEQIISLDGVQGFLFVAERLGERALASEEYWDDEFLRWVAEKESGTDVVRREVERARSANSAVDAYLKVVEAHERETSRSRRARVDWTAVSYDELRPLLGLRTTRRVPISALGRWGQSADERTIELVAHDLIRETDPERLLDYMRIFDRRSFPLDPQPLIRLASSTDERLAWTAARALGETRHTLVRQAALSLLADPDRRHTAVRLLISNYEPGDHVLIERALSAPQDTDDQVGDYHTLELNTLDVFEANPVPESATSLITLYERGPCSHCRSRCVGLLNELDSLPGWLIEECRHDSNLELRETASSLG